MKAEGEGVFGRVCVVASSHAHHPEPELSVEVEGGHVGWPDFESDEPCPPPSHELDDLLQDRLADPQAPEVRMDGDVVDLNVLADLPKDDVADDLVERRMNDHERKGYRPVLDFTVEGAFVPWVGEGVIFYGQDRRQVLHVHPPQEIKLLGKLVFFYRLSSAWDLLK